MGSIKDRKRLKQFRDDQGEKSSNNQPIAHGGGELELISTAFNHEITKLTKEDGTGTINNTYLGPTLKKQKWLTVQLG